MMWSIRSAPWSRYPIRSHTGQLPMYGMEAVMGTEQLQKDSQTELFSLLYMFDTADREAEEEAERVPGTDDRGRDFRAHV